MRYILGNFKANKTLDEMNQWLTDFKRLYTADSHVTVGLFPQYPYLALTHESVKELNQVVVGPQTIASVESGSFTGEVTAQAVSSMATHVIIGHSERRKNFGETDAQLQEKVKQSLMAGLTPVYCVRDEKDPIPDGVRFVAYEPVAAIGTGQNEPPEQTVAMKKKMNLPQGVVFIYGGSVNAQNAVEYFKTGEIDGFLIGKITLDPVQFNEVIRVAK